MHALRYLALLAVLPTAAPPAGACSIACLGTDLVLEEGTVVLVDGDPEATPPILAPEAAAVFDTNGELNSVYSDDGYWFTIR